jgi:hypothetical protein
MVALEPEQRVADQEVRDLAAAIVEHPRAPVRVLAAARVLVLVKVCPVEEDEAVGVLGEVGGDPVEEHADAARVELVDEGHEVLGPAVAPGRRVAADGLIAPRAVERVLHHGQELDVGEAHVARVVAELAAELAIVEEPVPLLGHAAPRAEVHLVDAHRGAWRLPLPPRRHPLRVPPRVRVAGEHGGGGARLVRLEGERVGIGLGGQGGGGGGEDLELVAGVRGDPGDEELPDAVAGVQAHRMHAPIPAVPVADHADPARVGRPHREGHAVDAGQAHRMGAELLEHAQMRALAEQVEVERGERRGEAVRVLDLAGSAVGVGHAEPVGEVAVGGARRLRNPRLPDPVVVERAERDRARPEADDADRARAGQQRADHEDAGVVPVRPQDREGIAVLGGDEGADLVGGDAHHFIVPEWSRRGYPARGDREEETTTRGRAAPRGPSPLWARRVRSCGSDARRARRGSGTGPCRGWSRAPGR